MDQVNYCVSRWCWRFQHLIWDGARLWRHSETRPDVRRRWPWHARGWAMTWLSSANDDESAAGNTFTACVITSAVIKTIVAEVRVTCHVSRSHPAHPVWRKNSQSARQRTGIRPGDPPRQFVHTPTRGTEVKLLVICVSYLALRSLKHSYLSQYYIRVKTYGSQQKQL